MDKLNTELEKFNNEFNRYVAPLYHAAYDL